MTQQPESCVHCGCGDGDTPLVPFSFRGRRWSICSQHLPVLIHDPARLVGQLPGAEGLAPAEHKD